MSQQKIVGRLGENCAAKFLEAKGYTIEAAGVFLQNKECYDCACRFDVVEVFLCGKEVEEINHIENAFEVSQEI